MAEYFEFIDHLTPGLNGDKEDEKAVESCRDETAICQNAIDANSYCDVCSTNIREFSYVPKGETDRLSLCNKCATKHFNL